MDCSPPGSSIRGISLATLQEWWPFSSPGDLLDPVIKLRAPALQADSTL